MIVHLREIDFVNERVETLAGNGTKGSDYQGGRKGTSQARNLIPRMFLIILRDQRVSKKCVCFFFFYF